MRQKNDGNVRKDEFVVVVQKNFTSGNLGRKVVENFCFLVFLVSFDFFEGERKKIDDDLHVPI